MRSRAQNVLTLIVFLMAACLLFPAVASAGEVALDGKTFTLAEELTIEVAAQAPLTLRPICVDFDEQGNLYIAESSGSNEPVEVQLKKKPHSILRLSDTDGDGVFDKRTVFAEGLMFPEGCTWHDGSLYVAAPPQIWKLTDTNGDGTADQREVWFDGKTLTGCANDLHGPYVGPDGQLYWCKGAFAKQTYERPDGKPFSTRASHIFRRDPQEGFVEPVLTGGMDNPVGIAFTRSGDPILTCTFLQQPSRGRRDGLIHAVYGGMWGKQHGVLEGHPQTGDLMPPLAHLGAAAMAGIAAVDGGDWNSKEQLLACSFNLHQVTRHELTPKGATFEATTEPWLKCDDVDFHPTDVIQDADGSFLVVDTGGWYKLCCPTSQLHKPDVTGAIYRVRVAGRPAPDDPRGLQLDWDNASTKALIARLADGRSAVRQRALAALGKQPAAVDALAAALEQATDDRTGTLIVWALTRIDSPEARGAVRAALPRLSNNTLAVAIRSAGLWRDAQAADAVREYLASDNAQTARIAATALGRMEDRASVGALLDCAARAESDRFLFHATTYALIEIAAPQPTHAGLASEQPEAVRAALWALDQMPGGALKATDVVPLLDQPAVRDTALALAIEHPEWGPVIAEHLEQKLTVKTIDNPQDLAALAATIANQEQVQSLLAEVATSGKNQAARRIALEAMAKSGVTSLPPAWASAIAAALNDKTSTERVRAAAIAAARAPQKLPSSAGDLRDALLAVATSKTHGRLARLQALEPISRKRALPANAFQFLAEVLTSGESVSERLLAADILLAAKLAPRQSRALAGQVADLGPMELNRVLLVFGESTDAETGRLLAAALQESDAASDVPVGRLKAAFAKFEADVQALAEPLFDRPEVDSAARAAELESRLKTIAQGDPRRGQAIFNSSKAACASCHSVGYTGGEIGPDLTRIGKIRTERDLLEAILFPSASFVRSYEPITVLTDEGQVHSGVPSEQSAESITLVMAADKKVTIPRDQITLIQPAKVSIMPDGLDKQLTKQELADLVMFLKTAQ